MLVAAPALLPAAVPTVVGRQVVMVALVHLMHFSWSRVQPGYRFGNDVVGTWWGREKGW